MDIAVPLKSMARNTMDEDGTRIEYLWNPVLFKQKHAKKIFRNPTVGTDYLLPQALVNLRFSHINRDINWYKHLSKMMELKFHPDYILYPEFITELREHWDTIHGPIVHSDTSMNHADFFTNAINETPGQHDELHERLSGLFEPMYKSILKDGSEVDICDIKLKELGVEKGIELIAEEIQVMAYERYKDRFSYKDAYKLMLQKFIMSHASPYMEILCVFYYDRMLQACNFDYMFYLDEGYKYRSVLEGKANPVLNQRTCIWAEKGNSTTFLQETEDLNTGERTFTKVKPVQKNVTVWVNK